MLKKNRVIWMLLLALILAGGGSAGAHSALANASELSVLVNGVPVESEANHSWGGKTYVSVGQFAKLFGKTASVGQDHQSVEFNGGTITDVREHQGEMTAWVRELARLVDAQSITWDADRNEVYVLALPKGSVQITPVVPAMGEHWSNPEAGELPVGPIYGVYQGRLVFLEYMIAQEDFIQGKNHNNLAGMKGVPSPSVVQTDFEFQPHGHDGFQVPHYDIHAYFITEEEQQSIR